MWQALSCLQIEVLVVTNHLKHKRLEISANILFTCNYLSIQIFDITITKPAIVLGSISLSKREFKFTTLLSLSFYFYANNYCNFGFYYSPLGTCFPSSRITAKHTLVSKCSTVNIILFLFTCPSKEKKKNKTILKYDLNYILYIFFIFSFIHSSNASASDTVSVKLSLLNLSEQEYAIERYLNFNYSTYNLL